MLVTSTGRATTEQPKSSSFRFMRIMSASFLEQIPKRQPSFPRAKAIPAPIPLDAPVIQATFPANEMDMIPTNKQ